MIIFKSCHFYLRSGFEVSESDFCNEAEGINSQIYAEELRLSDFNKCAAL